MRKHSVSLVCLVSGLVMSSCAWPFEGDEPELVAAYVFLGDDRSVESVDDIVMCNGWEKCSPAGFVAGLMAATSARDVARGGWGLHIEFQRSWSDEELAPVRAELTRRAKALALGSIEFVRADDEWPSCRGEADCLTVDESIIP